MRLCEVCGNEINGTAIVCPFCETHHPGAAPARTAPLSGRVITVNLEEGLPTVEQALSRLDTALLRARDSGVTLLRLIHGYGSSGVGGRLREAVRIQLNYLRRSGRVRLVVPGEEYASRTAETKRLMKRYPVLMRCERTDSRNPGITFVEC